MRFILFLHQYTKLVAVMAKLNPNFIDCIADTSSPHLNEPLFMLPTGDKVYFDHNNKLFWISNKYGTNYATMKFLDDNHIDFVGGRDYLEEWNKEAP